MGTRTHAEQVRPYSIGSHLESSRYLVKGLFFAQVCEALVVLKMQPRLAMQDHAQCRRLRYQEQTDLVRLRKHQLLPPHDRLSHLIMQAYDDRVAILRDTVRCDAPSPGNIPPVICHPGPSRGGHRLLGELTREIYASSEGEELQGRERAGKGDSGLVKVECRPADSGYEVFRVRGSPGPTMVNGSMDDDAKVGQRAQLLERGQNLALCKMRRREIRFRDSTARLRTSKSPHFSCAKASASPGARGPSPLEYMRQTVRCVSARASSGESSLSRMCTCGVNVDDNLSRETGFSRKTSLA